MRSVNRRKFIKSTSGLLALAAMDLGLPGARGQERPSAESAAPGGANERLNVAVIGLGGRSGSHLGQFNAAKNCRITHICDPDSATAEQAINRARRSNGEGVEDPTFVQDMRRIMDDRSVHIVSIATCNHWHSLAAIWAMQAGKDVYVEKPMSHNFFEGKRVAEVMSQTKQLCQAGTQMRSNPSIIDAVAYVQSGKMGRMLISRGLCYKTRNSIGKVAGPQQPPSTVDYNLWCGPAPMAPIMRERFHYDWHWQWDWGNGDIGNQGIHEIDLARWAAGINAYPTSVFSVGGRFGYVDDGQTPNTQVAELSFGPDKPKIVLEVRGLNTQAYYTRGVENVVECESGYLVSPNYTSAVAYDKEGNVLEEFRGGGDQNHFGNFIDAVRSRKAQDLHMPAAQSHLSDAILHLANISFHAGKPMPIKEYQAKPTDSDPDANKAIDRMIEHLAANEVPIDSTSMTVGPRLNFDPAKGQFINDPQANALLTREYRAPFVVPKA